MRDSDSPQMAVLWHRCQMFDIRIHEKSLLYHSFLAVVFVASVGLVVGGLATFKSSHTRPVLVSSGSSLPKLFALAADGAAFCYFIHWNYLRRHVNRELRISKLILMCYGGSGIVTLAALIFALVNWDRFAVGIPDFVSCQLPNMRRSNRCGPAYRSSPPASYY